MGPAAHHVIGDFRMELQANSVPTIAIGLVGEIRPANCEELGTFGKIESVGMPLVDRAWELGRAQPFAEGVGSIGSSRSRCACRRTEYRAPSARANIAREGRGRTAVSRRAGFEPFDLAPDQSSVPLAPIGPRNATTASVVRERPRQRLAATRPANVEPDADGLEREADAAGVECSWCRQSKRLGAGRGSLGHGHKLHRDVVAHLNRDPTKANPRDKSNKT